VLPFVLELRATHVCTSVLTSSISDLLFIKPIPASSRLIQNAREVAIERPHRFLPMKEALQLRMMAVTCSASEQNSSSQKSLPPQRDESTRIEMSGVN
jgi:hypothetical protein